MKKTIKANIILLASVFGIVLLIAFLTFSDRAFSAYREQFPSTYIDQDYDCNYAVIVHGALRSNFLIPARSAKMTLLDENGQMLREVSVSSFGQPVDFVIKKPSTTQTYQIVVRVYSYWFISSEVARKDIEIDGTDKCGTYDVDTDDNGFACEQSPDGASISQEEAIELVRARPEVQDFISLINTSGDSEAYIEYDHDECNTYSIHVYEIKDDHTATFNWYDVNMYTGEVTTMVDF